MSVSDQIASLDVEIQGIIDYGYLTILSGDVNEDDDE